MKNEQSIDTAKVKADFVKQMHSPLQMQLLFNYLPDVYFFAKNREGKFIMGNDKFVRQCGAETEEEIIGKTDHDFFPKERADAYTKDDKQVMETGESIIGRIELEPDPARAINWFITTKVPVYSEKGKIIGIAGTALDINRADLALRPYAKMQTVFEYVNQNYSQPIAIKELADLVHLSVSQFERRFRKLFEISPIAHIMNVRIRAASKLLTTNNNTIASIALDCGFYDHAHFTRSFKKHMGVSPKEYRNQTLH